MAAIRSRGDVTVARLLGSTRRRVNRALWVILVLALALLAGVMELSLGGFVHGFVG